MLFVKNIIDSRLATTKEQAEKLLNTIKELKDEEFIEVNFAGVDVVTSNFVSPFVWQLFLSEIKENKVRIKGLTASQKSLFATTKELASKRLGRKEIKFPKTKAELIQMISSGYSVAVRLNSEKDMQEAVAYCKRKIKGKIVTVSLENLENFSTILAKTSDNKSYLDYAYLSVELRDKFATVYPWYMENEEMKKEAKNWEDLT